jgi:hypothetical protein
VAEAYDEFGFHPDPWRAGRELSTVGAGAGGMQGPVRDRHGREPPSVRRKHPIWGSRSKAFGLRHLFYKIMFWPYSPLSFTKVPISVSRYD